MAPKPKKTTEKVSKAPSGKGMPKKAHAKVDDALKDSGATEHDMAGQTTPPVKQIAQVANVDPTQPKTGKKGKGKTGDEFDPTDELTPG